MKKKIGSCIFYVLSLSYLVMLYVVMFFFLRGWLEPSTIDASLDIALAFVGKAFLLVLGMGLIFMILSIVFFKISDRKVFRICTRIFKYGLIPFYLVGGVCMVGSAFMLWMAPYLLTIILGFSIYGYLVLLSVAPISLSYILKARKDKVISIPGAVLAGIGMFLMVFDVVAFFIVAIIDHTSRPKKSHHFD